MHEPTYRQALTHAWHLVWHNKILWAFGIIAVFLGHFGMSGVVGELFFPSNAATTVILYSAQFKKLALLGWNPLWLFWLAIIILAMVFLAMVGAASSQGALIATSGVWFARRSTLAPKLAWHAGTARWWSLFLVTLTEKILLAVFFFIIVISLNSIGSAANALEFFGSIALVALGIFLGLLITVLAIYTKGYIVMDEASVAGALRQARALLSNHFLVSLETSVILVALSAVVLLVVTTGTVLLLIPTALFTLLAAATGYSGLLAVGWIITLALSTLFVVMVGGIYNAYSITVWTYLFMKMHHEGVGSRVLHWFGADRFKNR